MVYKEVFMKVKTIIVTILLCLYGCDKESVNQALIDGERITAAYNLSAVESLASTYSKGLLLLSIRSDNVEYDGFAQKWCFRYSSGGIAVDYYFHTTSTNVIFDSTSILMYVGLTFISHKWCNSDEALRIAENNGGKDFRMKNSEYSIEASLGEPLVPNSTTLWYITYRSKLDSTKSPMFGIDAKTKEVTLKYP
jgi:hypothetical protein